MAPSNQEGTYCDMSEACGLPAGEGWSLGGHMGDSQHGGTVGGLGLTLDKGEDVPLCQAWLLTRHGT